MKMKPSKVLRKLRNGEVVNCINVHFDPQVTDIVGRAGFDCVWIDNEHLAQDWSSLQTHIWAAKSNDMDVMVRVSRGGYSDYIKPLEMDATGIMVPHIMGIDDARKVVQMTRFHPIGRRPLDGGNADGAYATINYADYLPLANRERFIIVQIEDPEPMADLDAIASLDGIDMLFFGPADFSQGIGAPGEWDHPKLVDARRRVAEVAIKHGKFAGTTGNINNMAVLMELGYKFINIGADVLAVGEYCKNLMAGFSENIEG
jgi:4-hydroxy-2-oxoheptanedioate aldolase